MVSPSRIAARKRGPTPPRRPPTSWRGVRSLLCRCAVLIVVWVDTRGFDMNFIQRFSILSIALAAPAAFAGTSATPFSEPTDPARWYQPLETPRAKHDNA